MSSSQNPVITWFPELNNLVLGNGDEFIYPINKSNVLLAGDIGFYRLDYERYRAPIIDSPFPISAQPWNSAAG